MRQTLLYLPERILGYPLWGLGWGLAFLASIVLVQLVVGVARGRLSQVLTDWGTTWVVAFLVLYLALPALEQMPPVAAGDELPNHGVPIRGYGVMLALAVGSGLWLAAARSRGRGFHPDIIYRLATWMILAGLAGARLFYVLQNPSEFLQGSIANIVFQLVNIAGGGLVVYGALIGAAVAFVWFSIVNRLPPVPLADVVAPSLVLGQAIGRIGCFLNGCCWGGLGDVPWAVRFPSQSPPHLSQVEHGLILASAPTSLPVHPAQLYETISCLLILGVLLSLERETKRPGEIAGLALLLYSLSRFVIEWIRDDQAGLWGTSLTLSQYLSLLIAIFSLFLLGNFFPARSVQPMGK